MRSGSLLVILAAGCGIENGLADPAPSYPNSEPPPIASVRQTDVIVQLTTPKVDVLWMVDNSCSMSNEQADLTENFPSFMGFFVGSGLDYHVGVTSSDTISDHYPGSDGTLVVKRGVSYIEPETPDPVGLFQEMATLGITGRFPERGLGATYLALEVKRDTINAGFYRDDAALHTIIISDEPDYTESFVITQPEYAAWYDTLKDEADERTFSAIIDLQRGTKYKTTAEDVGGIVWGLDQENWPQVLELLGLQAAGLKREYFLSRRPVPGTIDVTIETPEGVLQKYEETTDWTYDEQRNSITFVELIPEALSSVIIEYTVAASVVDQEIEDTAASLLP